MFNGNNLIEIGNTAPKMSKEIFCCLAKKKKYFYFCFGVLYFFAEFQIIFSKELLEF